MNSGIFERMFRHHVVIHMVAWINCIQLQTNERHVSGVADFVADTDGRGQCKSSDPCSSAEYSLGSADQVGRNIILPKR
jgi:hypothetical protein